jgi:hypothetical protein
LVLNEKKLIEFSVRLLKNLVSVHSKHFEKRLISKVMLKNLNKVDSNISQSFQYLS